MTPRLIFSGYDISYGRLLELRHPGEKIVAVWRRDLLNTVHILCITGERDYTIIAGQTKNGFYHSLRWYGTSTGSVDPADYGVSS